MLSGLPNDVNNTINIGDVYNYNDFPVDIGVPMGNVETAPTNDIIPGEPTSSNTVTATVASPLGKPAHWWLGLLGTFAVFIFLARKYGGGDKYSNIRASVYNLFFMTVFMVLMLNFLKVIAAKWNIPGFSALILAA